MFNALVAGAFVNFAHAETQAGEVVAQNRGGKCTVTPNRKLDLAQSVILKEKGYTVNEFKGSMLDDWNLFLGKMDEGEYVILTYGNLEGFELYQKSGKGFNSIASEHSYSEKTSLILMRSLPQCSK